MLWFLLFAHSSHFLLSFPGTIATTILYINLASGSGNPVDFLSVAAAIGSALVAAWLVMRSLWIVNHTGRTGILVLSRILGILLAALAIQFVLNGIVEYVHVSGFVK